ncbi:hypothetical protein B7G68_15155 [Caulobacter segnis]|uniref:Uncharacterized protein n=2 Tax=Caulobacter segnis TaxID=88688 RepID=D5VLM8_CAUST|nr:hypothetical protein [Caulobacter segnis]ADG11401.1 hypothetical protein Cseg_2957 [Caulobacter segnis ATCC 21756]AVQ03069.1 hypothetical protein B7G68_15155 [Caulobacter segnis]
MKLDVGAGARLIKRKHILALAVVLAPLTVAFWVCGFTGKVSRVDLAAISGSTEVAIGICASYLAFDRFRFHARFNYIARRITREKASGPDVLIASRSDGAMNSDEIGLLSVYYLAGDEQVVKYFKSHEHLLSQSEFLDSVTGKALALLLQTQIDRMLIMALAAVLCAWEMASAVFQLQHSLVTAWLPPAKILCAALIGTGAGYLLPALFFVSSKLLFDNVERYMDRRFKSMAVTMKREAETVSPPKLTPAPKTAASRSVKRPIRPTATKPNPSATRPIRPKKPSGPR